jgi:methyl-accepting chemotaxis protein
MNLMAALDEHRSASQQLAQAKSVLNEALASFRAMTTEGMQALRQVEQAAHTLLDGQRSAATTTMKMQQLQDKASENAVQLAQQLTRLGEMYTVQKETLDRFQAVFQTVEVGLSKVLTELTHSMQQYSSVVQEYTEKQLNKFDDSFSQAAQELKNSSDIVRDGLEQITGPLEELVKRLGR